MLNALFGIFVGLFVLVLSFLVILLDDVNIDVSYINNINRALLHQDRAEGRTISKKNSNKNIWWFVVVCPALF